MDSKLHHVRSAVGLVLAVFTIAVFAKTPQQLTSEFADILPSDMKARAAWLHRAPDGKLSVYVVDSDTGVIRELTPASIFPGKQRNFSSFHPPLITYDGSRVIFMEGSSSTWYVINWDGSGLYSFSCSGKFPAGYWHNRADNSDWVIHDGSINRTNVDKHSQRVLLWNKSGTVWPGWFTLSEDGTRVGMSQDNQVVGIAVVPNGTFKAGDSLGCRVSIAPDNSYDFIFQTPYHRLLRMCDSNGVKKQDYRFNDTIISWAKENRVFVGGLLEHDNVRWTNNRDYIIFYMNCTSVNPYVMRLSDQKWMYLADGLSSLGAADMCVFPRGPHGDVPPVISAVNDLGCQVSRGLQLAVRVRGTPGPTIEVNGLPRGVALVNDTVRGDSVVISGVPDAAGKSTVVVTATNPIGVDRDTFTITVGIYNDTPTVYAGRDTTTRIGHDFSLGATASDDGIVNAELLFAWRQIAGPDSGSAIANAASLTTAVTFTRAGDYKFRLRADDGGIVAADTVAVKVLPEIPFIVLKPAAAARVRLGGIDTVKWQIDPPTSVIIELSTNAGLSYEGLTVAAVPAGQTSWVWSVSDTLALSDSCMVSVRTYEAPHRYAYSGVFSLVEALEARFRTGAALFSGEKVRDYRYYSLDGRRLDPAQFQSLRRGSGAPVHGVVICRGRGETDRVRRVVFIGRARRVPR